MMRSLFSGVTGLRSHQTRMDVIGNNISNVNTLGFKKSATNFSDLYSQTITPSSAPAANSGGTNAKQVGLGVNVSSVVIQHSPGAAQYTGAPLDLAIAGDGFFAVRTSDGLRYTRAGNFTLSSNGSLVTPSGHFVQAYNAAWKTGDAGVAKSLGLDGKKSTHFSNYGFNPNTQAMTTMPSGNYTFSLDPTTGDMKLFVNGKAVTPAPAITVPTMVTDSPLSDSTGQLASKVVDNIKLTGGNIPNSTDKFTITAHPTDSDKFIITDNATPANTTTITITVADLQAGTIALGTVGTTALGNITFDAKASATASDVSALVQDIIKMNSIVRSNGTVSGPYLIDIAGFGQLTFDAPVRKTQLTEEAARKDLLTILNNASIDVINNDGFISGTTIGDMTVDVTKYYNISVDESGAVIGQLKEDTMNPIPGTGFMAKGEKVVLGYITITKFTNPEGLEKVATNLYAQTPNSGRPAYSRAGMEGVGAITPSSLEMSNVDMSEEMVSMIVTQRGFQSNSRVITVTDQMLEELINLKR